MWRWSDGTTELYHYGIKGMKWGVRRTKEQLAHDRYSIQARTIRRLKKPFYSANGVLVTSISAHALDRCEEKSRPVTVEGIFDALKKPLNHDSIKTKYDGKGRPSQRLIGKMATVNVNPENGIITTVWPTGHDTLRKYSKKR
jgi:hypothetical protein